MPLSTNRCMKWVSMCMSNSLPYMQYTPTRTQYHDTESYIELHLVGDTPFLLDNDIRNVHR